MAPLLIDSRDLLKYGFISVLVTVLVFAGGFLLGHQQAATFYLASSEIKSLSLPEQTAAAEDIVDAQVPSIVEAGEEIDVDQPEVRKQAVQQPARQPKKSTTDPKITEQSVPRAVPRAVPQTAPQKDTVADVTDADQPAEPDKNIPGKKATVIIDNSADDSSDTDKATAVLQQALVVSTLSSDQLSKIKYSIQAGTYGRLVNAENMVKMLQAQHYDAYVTDYRNKKNQIRYNVRFGYFSDKKSAIIRLGEFKADGKGDGYLVKFSADNIVKLADVSGIEQATDVPAKSDATIEGPGPEIVPSAILQDKVSQLDDSELGNLRADHLNGIAGTTLVVTTN